jgi:hypothetical protein
MVWTFVFQSYHITVLSLSKQLIFLATHVLFIYYKLHHVYILLFFCAHQDAAKYRDELKILAPHCLLKCSSDATTLVSVSFLFVCCTCCSILKSTTMVS